MGPQEHQQVTQSSTCRCDTLSPLPAKDAPVARRRRTMGQRLLTTIAGLVFSLVVLFLLDFLLGSFCGGVLINERSTMMKNKGRGIWIALIVQADDADGPILFPGEVTAVGDPGTLHSLPRSRASVEVNGRIRAGQDKSGTNEDLGMGPVVVKEVTLGAQPMVAGAKGQGIHMETPPFSVATVWPHTNEPVITIQFKALICADMELDLGVLLQTKIEVIFAEETPARVGIRVSDPLRLLQGILVADISICCGH